MIGHVWDVISADNVIAPYEASRTIDDDCSSSDDDHPRIFH